jgi:hypothetical protein
MKRTVKIEAGQKFRSIGVTGRPTYVYVVEAIFRSTIDQRDYARLVEALDRTHTKTIALATLLDPRHFQPSAELPEGPDAPRSQAEIRRAALGTAP